MPDYETYADDEEEPDFWVFDPEEEDDLYELEGGVINAELNLAIARAFTMIEQVDDDGLIVMLPNKIKQEIAQLINRSTKHYLYNEPLKALTS